jgi:two-component system response regulator YesN
MMPSMGGLKVIEYASKENPNLLFAMITAIDDKETIQKAFDLNIIDYLVKPVKKQETLELIETAKRKLENRNLEKNIKEKEKEVEELLDIAKNLINFIKH